MIINDTNFTKYLKYKDYNTGGRYINKNRFVPYNAKTFNDLQIERGVALISEADWDDAWSDIQKYNASIETMCNDLGLPALDQAQTNYCWINGPVHTLEIARLKETGKVVSYSPASGGARIKNFNNSGGWTSEALDHMVQNGINETSDWPANAIDRQYLTNENKQLALKNVVTEYYYLSTWQERISCILAGYATADGYNWWRHVVIGCGIIIGSHDLRVRNSWGMDWGERGFGTLSGSKKHADGSICIVNALAS